MIPGADLVALSFRNAAELVESPEIDIAVPVTAHGQARDPLKDLARLGVVSRPLVGDRQSLEKLGMVVQDTPLDRQQRRGAFEKLDGPGIIFFIELDLRRPAGRRNG